MWSFEKKENVHIDLLQVLLIFNLIMKIVMMTFVFSNVDWVGQLLRWSYIKKHLVELEVPMIGPHTFSQALWVLGLL